MRKVVFRRLYGYIQDQPFELKVRMITLEKVQKKYYNFGLEATEYPEIQSCMDQQFKDCLLAGRLGCQIPRDILPFCGKILTITQFVFDQRNENPILFKNWNCILKYLCQNDGVTVERFGLPPTQLCFPLSRSVLKGKDVTFDKISFLDSSNNSSLEKIIKHSLRFTDQSCGYSVFSEKSLRMMLTADNTLCAYSTTIQGRITAVVWGVKLQIQQLDEMVPCFYILFAAREPEYSGQNIYEKMIRTFQPLLINEGNFKSEFLCWKQGKNNSINNNALVKFKDALGEVSRSEGEAYTFEAAENCSLRLDQQSTIPLPGDAVLEEALQKYALSAGDILTFAYEFPILMFKINLFWNAWYNKTFPTQKDYQNSLQPI